MYSIGDKIVHPMHGAGVIKEVVTQKVEGKNHQYYVMNVLVGGIVVMIPVLKCGDIGVRLIIDSSRAEEILMALPNIEIDMTQNWSRRYRENMLRIKSGDLTELCKVIKGLVSRDRERGLSTGERKMLNSARQILISEIVLAQSTSYEDVERRLDAQLA